MAGRFFTSWATKVKVQIKSYWGWDIWNILEFWIYREASRIIYFTDVGKDSDNVPDFFYDLINFYDFLFPIWVQFIQVAMTDVSTRFSEQPLWRTKLILILLFAKTNFII